MTFYWTASAEAGSEVRGATTVPVSSYPRLLSYRFTSGTE